MSELVQHVCQVFVYKDDGTVVLWRNDLGYLAENEPESVDKVRRCGKQAYDFVDFGSGDTQERVWMCFDYYFQYENI